MKKLVILLLLTISSSIVSAQSQFNFADVLATYEPTVVADPDMSMYQEILGLGSRKVTKQTKNPISIIQGYTLNSFNKWKPRSVKITWDDKGYYVTAIIQDGVWRRTNKCYLQELSKYDKYYKYFTYKVNIQNILVVYL